MSDKGHGFIEAPELPIHRVVASVMNTPWRVAGLTDSAQSWYAGNLLREHPHVLIICPDDNAADRFIQDLRFFYPESNPVAFPAWGTLPFEMVSPAPEVSAARTYAQLVTLKQDSFCLVASVQSLLQRIVPEAPLTALTFSLSSNTAYPRQELLAAFHNCGYTKVSLVEHIGEIAIRGNVIDFFPSGTETPIRLEFFDTLLEKIKTFDPRTQRSTGSLTTYTVLPITEALPFKGLENPKLLEQALTNIKAQGIRCETPPREIAKSISAIQNAIHIPGYEILSFIALDTRETLFDALPQDTLCIIQNELAYSHTLAVASDHIDDRELRLSEQHYLTPRRDMLFLSSAELHNKVSAFSRVLLGSAAILESIDDSILETKRIVTREHARLGAGIHEKLGSAQTFSALRELIQQWKQETYRIAFVVGSKGRSARLQELLQDLEIETQHTELSFPQWLDTAEAGIPVILFGHLEQGFVHHDEKFALISENEIFSKKSYRTGKLEQKDLKRLLSSLGQLAPGNLVVHEDFGVGRYQGLKHLAVEGSEGDFAHIEYADSTLYLPAHNISKIQKYVGAEGSEPQLDKLSSQRWLKTKAKVREAVATLAGELVALYAARQVAEGFAFDPITREDEQFADSFPFDETPDQRTAIEDTLNDMQSIRPMDRLICGDVGFGKTEVAIRAAFKCVNSGKQVAVLVPTTILVEQHTNSFLERFRGYPVRIRAMSRFYGRKEIEETTTGLRSGKVDIVIGTHKLLGKNIEFKDLGLLIIDEEHRFGVKQKEKLKQLKRKIDVLTLTATPIPRTLHMAMLSIRDISIISTAPTDRRVIKTYLAQRNELLIRDTLLREYQRGGQSFFLHNRVQTISSITAGLHELCPELHFEFAHGQMSEGQLSSIMRRFLAKEIDVLVCTTIIESGIDIPNANTILIDRADTFGLAQLYQIRGRVGRSSKQAYCYFLIPPMRRLGAEAQQRLKALQALDDLGQGFQLALRDLEIRGAGNLLGKEQSGNVISVGYDLYTKILNEAVAHLKGDSPALVDTIDPDIRIKSHAFIPDYYIPDISERLILYQRLTSLSDLQEADALRLEIEDRFGAYGEEVENLLLLMHIRILCKASGVVQLDKIRDRLILSFAPQAPVKLDLLLGMVQAKPDTYRLTSNQSLSVPWQTDFESISKLYSYLESLLRRITYPDNHSN